MLATCRIFVFVSLCTGSPLEAPQRLNASHAVARGIVERASDYYCQTHCYELCGYRSGWCCGADDCHYGSHRCACYNYCYCPGSDSQYQCYHCDL